jgi:hypothetical protein
MHAIVHTKRQAQFPCIVDNKTVGRKQGVAFARFPSVDVKRGFPVNTFQFEFYKNYKLIGTKTEKKKYIGNAVEVNMAKAMCAAIGEVSLKENMAA